MPLSGWSRRHRLTQDKEEEEWDGDFRNPPKPKHYWNAKKGWCRWCGGKITKTPTERRGKTQNLRKTWHEDCATHYMIIYHSREARHHVWRRDKGVCNSCGVQCTRRGWDLDHIKPLMEQKGVKKSKLDWSYYGLDNMQTLCKSCHKKKTKVDMENGRRRI